MKLSARNQFKGIITEIQEGAVNGIVKLDIGGGNIISSVITMSSIRELGLQVGGTAYAVIKASNVMVGVDE
ncbi:MAG: molybdopterin-binding protein [Oscillospiraceae bacterium]|nr:molybdopterin-binding protein [Oscillospiraceae bacterium]